MKYLLIVAHPDDEVLGAGATIKKLTGEGHTVELCLMCAEVEARKIRPEDGELLDDIKKSSEMLGISKIYRGSFPNIEMNNSPHIKLVQFIENAITEATPDVLITHHPSDTNNDHLHTSMACQAAMRLFQRKNDIKPLSEVWFMEILSSTEWSINSSMNRFTPNTYIEIGKTNLEVKVKALEAYRGVMRDYPHPRSKEAIKGLAAYRGSQSGCLFAEAYECVFRRITA